LKYSFAHSICGSDELSIRLPNGRLPELNSTLLTVEEFYKIHASTPALKEANFGEKVVPPMWKAQAKNQKLPFICIELYFDTNAVRLSGLPTIH
jgi:hypothetical protein